MTRPTTPMPPLLLVGCGRMGQALLAGWNRDGLSPSWILDPEALLPSGSPHHVARSVAELDPDFRPTAVILAVKPQVAADAMRSVESLSHGAVVMSIMAGCTLSTLGAALPNAGGMVRAMPNMPAAIGRGISVAVPAAGTGEECRLLCDRLLRAAGSVEWVEDESLLDAVTAVSGSGPAYVFLLAELLEQAARAQGLSPALARRLARETVSGAGALLAAWPDEDASTLRRGVTSPGGTTEAALSVLMQTDAWPALVEDAIAKATDRSRALAR